MKKMSVLKKGFICLLLLIFTGFGRLSAQQFQISLLTCDSGEEIYTAFGHSAIRVQNLLTGQDLVYNYGTFDFGAPYFVLNFAGGRLDYFLSVSTFDRFYAEYNYFQRNMREQELDLNPDQVQNLVDFLQTNYQPENRNYRYDFFYDNCATRIRDAMEKVLGEQLVWQDEEQEPVEKTFRELIDEKVFYMPWSDLGIDLALGSKLDRDARPREEQFLPSYMEESFARAMIVGDGPSRPLVRNSRVILEFPPLSGSLGLINPYLIFWVIAIGFTLVTFIGFRKKKLLIGFDLGLFGVLGLIGLVITALWIGSDIPSTKLNWNVLWAFPGHLILVFALWNKKRPAWVSKYLLGALILSVLALVIWMFGVQSFHPSLVPLFLVIILRCNFLYYNLERLGGRAG